MHICYADDVDVDVDGDGDADVDDAAGDDEKENDDH